MKTNFWIQNRIQFDRVFSTCFDSVIQIVWIWITRLIRVLNPEAFYQTINKLQWNMEKQNVHQPWYPSRDQSEIIGQL